MTVASSSRASGGNRPLIRAELWLSAYTAELYRASVRVSLRWSVPAGYI